MLRLLLIFTLLLSGIANGLTQTTDLQNLLTDLQEVSKTPERVDLIDQKISELQSKIDQLPDTQEMAMRLEILEKSAADVYPKAVALADNLGKRITDLESAAPAAQPSNDPYTFVLRDDDGDGFIDDEWEEIIKAGQTLQAKVWAEKEQYWTDRIGTPPAGEVGWYGSSTMPVIRIVCESGEHFAHGTLRLPGRFELTSPSRWGAMIRFEADDQGKHLIDDIAYGVATNAKIGIYVEPKTIVITENGTMIVKPFEQTIERVVLVAMNGVLPVYLAQNQDRFLMDDCNVQQHQGAQIGIKHGPPLQGRSYPFPATQVLDGSTYLADPRITNVQFEGPHNATRKQAAVFMSGNNIQLTGLNFYGWTHGILCHGGQGRVVSGITMHDGITADGRRFTTKENIVAVALSTRTGLNPDSVSGVAGGFKVWILPKQSPAPETAGWYIKGQGIL